MKQTHKRLLTSKAKILLAVFLCVFIACAAAALFARAGGGQSYSGGSGGGGYHSSGGSANGLLLLIRIFLFLVRLSFECPIVGVPLLCAFIWFMWWGTTQVGTGVEGHKIAKTATDAPKYNEQRVLALVKRHIPSFNAANFSHRVTNAFMRIQKGWANQELGMAQIFLSDGIYEQFTIQIDELKSQGVVDFMQDLQVLSTAIVGFESDNSFDTIHIQINAKAINYRRDKATQKLIDGSKLPEAFSEVWSFVRRVNAKAKNGGGLIEGQCPNCGSPIKMARLQKCEVCGAMLRSGQYDWVLTKITQACEWAQSVNATTGLNLMLKADKGFNIQHMAERASVIFWRKLASDRSNDLSAIKKVSSERFFNEYSLKVRAEGAQRSFYINCGVGGIRIVAIELGKDFDKAYAEIVFSAQKAVMRGKAIEAQGVHITTKRVFVLIRKHGVQTSLDSALSASHCPTCGAPTQDVAENACPYCNNPLNDVTKEWQLDDIISSYSPTITEAIRRIKNQFSSSQIVTNVPFVNPRPKTVSDAETIRWAVAMMLCDHEIDKAEIDVIQALAKKTYVSNAKLSKILAEFQAVENTAEYALNTTSITDGKLIMQEIAKVALADGKVTKEERQMLYLIASKLGYTKTNADALLDYMRRCLSHAHTQGVN